MTLKYLLSSTLRSERNTLLSRNTQQLQNRSFNTKTTFNMPLVVPGINSGGDNSKTEEWMNKLVGKKLTDGQSDATVRYSCVLVRQILKITVVCQARPSQGDSCYWAGNDGYQGLQARSVNTNTFFEESCMLMTSASMFISRRMEPFLMSTTNRDAA